MKLFRKAASLALAVALTVSLVPQVAFAAGAWEAPSMNAWTTDLSKFNLKSSSESDHNYKMLQFGKYNGKAINWYIAGADSKHADLLGYELDGESDTPWRPFGLGAFNSDGQNFILWDDSYGNYTDRTMLDTDKVGPNHYGASEIRAFLNSAALEGFSTKELEMIQTTTLTIADYLNKDDEGTYPSHYTVSDKLYLPNGDPTLADNLHIYLGSDGGLKVPLPNMKDSNHPFYVPRCYIWLAAPYYEMGLMGYPPLCVSTYYAVQNVLLANTIQQGSASIGACPACNLDLSSVLFFSAATATAPSSPEGGELTANDLPLIIRLEDTEGTTNLASASVKYDIDKITVKGGADPATLVVQWKVGTQDYYYKRAVEAGAEEEITTSDIVSASGSPAGALTKACAVWLEYTDNTSHITYAKKGEFEATDISDATLSGNGAPVYQGGEMIDPNGFNIEVTWDDMKLPREAYGLSFYPDDSCTPGEEVIVADAGVYYVLAIGNESAGYIGRTAPTKIKVNKAALPKPEVVGGTITYDGTEKTGVTLPAGADPAKYIISGNKATKVGSYMSEVALVDPNNYCWAGESGDPEDASLSKPFTIDWNIKPSADVPETGDSTNPALWSLIMVGSLAAMAACLILRKKDMEY